MSLGELFYQRINTTGLYTEGKYRKVKGAHRGFPDIFVMKQGRAIFLEIKSNSGDLSTYQKERQAELEAQGAEYYLVRSLKYAMQVLGY